MRVMKKDILFVDWAMLAIFGVLILSKILKFVTPPILQMSFMVLIGIHIFQHWKIIVATVKRKRK